MSGSAKRSADKLNTVTIVAVGICGAVLVYVSIVFLQAFYAADTAEVATMADYGGQDKPATSARAEQQLNISPEHTQPNGNSGTFTIRIADAMKLVVRDAKTDPSTLVPALGRSDVPTAAPVFGRPRPLVTPAAEPPAAAPAAAGSAAEPAAAAGSATTPAAAAGSAAAPAAAAPAAAGSATTPAAAGSGSGGNAR